MAPEDAIPFPQSERMPEEREVIEFMKNCFVALTDAGRIAPGAEVTQDGQAKYEGGVLKTIEFIAPSATPDEERIGIVYARRMYQGKPIASIDEVTYYPTPADQPWPNIDSRHIYEWIGGRFVETS